MQTAKRSAKDTHASTFHPAKKARGPVPTGGLQISGGPNKIDLTIAGRSITLTNLDKVFWAKEKITKGDLLQYYADISPVLLPHLLERAMVMKRYPNGAEGPFFFQKRAP